MPLDIPTTIFLTSYFSGGGTDPSDKMNVKILSDRTLAYGRTSNTDSSPDGHFARSTSLLVTTNLAPVDVRLPFGNEDFSTLPHALAIFWGKAGSPADAGSTKLHSVKITGYIDETL
jgi:hypothetical protein